jgi:hypothetical protein
VEVFEDEPADDEVESGIGERERVVQVVGESVRASGPSRSATCAARDRTLPR